MGIADQAEGQPQPVVGGNEARVQAQSGLKRLDRIARASLLRQRLADGVEDQGIIGRKRPRAGQQLQGFDEPARLFVAVGRQVQQKRALVTLGDRLGGQADGLGGVVPVEGGIDGGGGLFDRQGGF